jgi:hypothetical protein
MEIFALIYKHFLIHYVTLLTVHFKHYIVKELFPAWK